MGLECGNFRDMLPQIFAVNAVLSFFVLFLLLEVGIFFVLFFLFNPQGHRLFRLSLKEISSVVLVIAVVGFPGAGLFNFDSV